jgi:predicted N-acetyltransferase YhbS
MNITIRPGIEGDALACGRVCFRAFLALADRHGFPPFYPTLKYTVSTIREKLTDLNFYGVVAESKGRIVGSSFLDERSDVAALGPVSVESDVASTQVRQMFFEDAINRSEEMGRTTLRTIEESYDSRTVRQAERLGFETSEALVLMSGIVSSLRLAGDTVRTAKESDLDVCREISKEFFGYDRSTEILDAIRKTKASVVVRNGAVRGYTTGLSLTGHSVAATNDDLMALIASTGKKQVNFLLPTQNSPLLGWCMENGLQLAMPVSLLTFGTCEVPTGAYLHSGF